MHWQASVLMQVAMTDHSFKILALAALATTGVAWSGPLFASGDEGSAGGAGTAIPQANSFLPEGAPEPTPTLTSNGDGSALFAPPETPAAVSANIIDGFRALAPGPQGIIEATAQQPGGPGASGLARSPVPKLPTYTVRGSHVFFFRDRDLYTKEGMIDLSFSAHPGLHVGNVFDLNANKAYEMFLEDDWRRTKGDYWDIAHAMTMGGDRSEGRQILTAVNDEDTTMKGENESDTDPLSTNRFRVGQVQNDSSLLAGLDNPIDVPVVRIKW